MKSIKITTIISCIIILIFAVIFLSYFLGGNELEQTLKYIKNSAYENEWSEIDKGILALEKIWLRQKYVIMLNYAEVDYSDLGSAILRIKSAGINRDSDTLINECSVAEGLIDNIYKLVPEP